LSQVSRKANKRCEEKERQEAPTLKRVGIPKSHFGIFVTAWVKGIEKFNIRQPPKGEKDDDDSENSWISDGFPSSSRQRRRGDGR